MRLLVQTAYFPVGFVQFVESVAVAEVLNQHTGIQSFFKICAPCENTPYGFQPEVMDNFVKSCGKGDNSDLYILGSHLWICSLNKMGC